MNKFPLDQEGIQEIANNLVAHNAAQSSTIDSLVKYLREAMTYVPKDEEGTWYEQAEQLLQNIHKRKIDFSNFRFGQQNGGHRSNELSPYTEGPVDGSPPGHVVESEFGEEMSPEELAIYFNEELPKKEKKGKKVSDMTLEEIEEWEKKQDNSNDIYKIAARVKNLARSDGQAALMPAGEALCNVYTHVLKAFYDFADTLPPEHRVRMYDLIRHHEGMPGNLIAAGVGTKGNRK
jgi:hypothetical protein